MKFVNAHQAMSVIILADDKAGDPDAKSALIALAISKLCEREANGSVIKYPHISAETLKKTTIGTFKRGREMNLERSLRVGDRVGGHFVYGHIDCPGVLSGRYTRSSEEVFRFHVKENPQYLIPKGSISIDGISLTISSVISTGLFEVSVIPETVRRTNLDKLKINGRVNIEFDMMVKYLDGVSKNVRQH